MARTRWDTTLPVLAAAILLTAAVALAGAGVPAGTSRTAIGETKSVGDGTIRTWVTTAQGHPYAMGVTFSEAMLTGLPPTLPYTEYPLALPPVASQTPFTHFVLNWNPHGHIPPEIYDVPHFDFHFYFITPQVREQITTTGEDRGPTLKQPPAGVMPPGYITAPDFAEPRMGLHWGDQNAPEFHGKPFTYSFIYGSYNGQLAFIEPMATMAFLQSKQNVSEPIPQPGTYPGPGYYPTRWSLRYDAGRKEYTLVLREMVKR